MNKSNKIPYLCLFAIILLVNGVIITTASNVIKSKDSLEGPGTEKQRMIEMLDNIRKNNNLASNSEIFLHDGIYYAKGESKGKFSLSGYCACKKCSSGTGITASGKRVRENHTIASDWKVLPKGTMIILENAKGKDGQVYDGVYQVEDRGGGVKNNHLDIYRPTHQLASLVTYYGRAYGDVYIAIPVATASNIN